MDIHRLTDILWMIVITHALGALRMSIKDQIRAINDIEVELIEVPQWGVTLEVRSMSGKSRAVLLKEAAQEDGTLDFETLYPAILVACCYDPSTGDAVFESNDREWINEKSAGPVEKLAQAGMRLSGLAKEAIDEGKEPSS